MSRVLDFRPDPVGTLHGLYVGDDDGKLYTFRIVGWFVQRYDGDEDADRAHVQAAIIEGGCTTPSPAEDVYDGDGDPILVTILDERDPVDAAAIRETALTALGAHHAQRLYRAHRAALVEHQSACSPQVVLARDPKGNGHLALCRSCGGRAPVTMEAFYGGLASCTCQLCVRAEVTVGTVFPALRAAMTEGAG